jgi:hypothetical protein
MFTANVGSVDQVVRLVVGLILAVLPYVYDHEIWASPYVSYGMTVVGIILIVTAVNRFCPAYRLIGANTCRRIS